MTSPEKQSKSASKLKSLFGLGTQTNEEAQMQYMHKREIDELTKERDNWKHEAHKERSEKEKLEQNKRHLLETLTSKESEITRLKSRLSSHEIERQIALANEDGLKTRLRCLEEECRSKEVELNTYTQRAASHTSELRDKDNEIAQMSTALRGKDNDLVQAREEVRKLRRTIEERIAEEDNRRCHRQDADKEKRISLLQSELDEKHNAISSFSGTIQALELKLQAEKCRNEDLKKQIEGMETREHQFKHDAMRLTEDKARLTKEVDDMAKRLEEGKEEREKMSRKWTEDLTRTKVMEQKVRDYKDKIERLTQENQCVKDENVRLKEEKCVLEAQDNSSKRECGDVREKMAALKAASETRERMLQKDIVSLQHQRLQDMREQKERHRSEKKEMQSQIQNFLQTLNDQKHVERDTIWAAIQQMGQTNAITNQILQAAFTTYHRTRFPAANIQEIDDDP